MIGWGQEDTLWEGEKERSKGSLVKNEVVWASLAPLVTDGSKGPDYGFL